MGRCSYLWDSKPDEGEALIQMCGVMVSLGNEFDFIDGCLSHRGPDQFIKWSHNQNSVDYYRLSITGGLDGESPVKSVNNNWAVFLNGEIYNFLSLQKLYGLPDTQSDTQVLADGLEKVGLEFFRKLRGMFAGVAFNLRTSEIFVFRDFFGEKPLFFSKKFNSILLSSEFSPLLRHLDPGLELDSKSLREYLQFGYSLEPNTFDLRIKHFPRGTVSRYDSDSNQLVKVMTLSQFDSVESECDFDKNLKDSAIEALRCQVNAGFALSGGIDSEALGILIKDTGNANIRAYTFRVRSRFKTAEFKNARKVSKRLGFRQVKVELNAKQILSDLRKIALALDQPHADPAAIGYWKIFERMHEHGEKVAFLGHGPDEFYFGYRWYLDFVEGHGIDQALDHYSFFDRTPGMQEKLLSFLPENNFVENSNISYNSEDVWLTDPDKWKRACAEISQNYLAINGLRQSDRLAMFWGIEPRTPFADPRIYAWVQTHRNSNNKMSGKVNFMSLFGKTTKSQNEYRKQGFNTSILNELDNIDLNQFRNVLVKYLNIPVEVNLNHFFSRDEKYRLLMLALWSEGFSEIEG